MPVEVEIRDLEELMSHMDHAPRVITDHLRKGMKDAVELVVNTKGLKRYPPVGPANQPPAPYWRRGRGLVGRRGQILFRSERLGIQFYAKAWTSGRNAMGLGGQRASYSRYVIGDRQARNMAQKGWRKFRDVAIEKQFQIRDILEFYVQRALKYVDLWP